MAAAFGLVLGAALTLVSLRASKLVTPEDPGLGFAKVALLLLVRLVVVIAALFGYFLGAPEGFLAFGLALVCSFIASIGLEAFRLSSTRMSG